MSQKLVVLADPTPRAGKPRIDPESMKVEVDDLSDFDYVKKLGIDVRPLTPELKKIVVEERSGKAGGKPTTLGALGSILIVRLEDGQIVNRYSGSDFGCPMAVSRDSVRQLYEVFRGGTSTTAATKA